MIKRYRKKTCELNVGFRQFTYTKSVIGQKSVPLCDNWTVFINKYESPTPGGSSVQVRQAKQVEYISVFGSLLRERE